MQKCRVCVKTATWVRSTQFTGNHYFCDDHARKEPDFGEADPSYFIWEELPVSEDIAADRERLVSEFID